MNKSIGNCALALLTALLLWGCGGGSGSASGTTGATPIATGSFTIIAGPMSSAREGQSGSLLTTGPDAGKVLLAGGSPDGASIVDTAEIYDPASQTFTAVAGHMASARYGHTATVFPDGRILLTGGFVAASNVTNTAEIYDPVAGTFTAIAGTMTAARYAHTATLLTTGADAGKVLLTGGLDDTGKVFDTAELYDPLTQTFTALPATLTVTREGHTATLLTSGPDAGKVLLAGGSRDGAQQTLGSVEIYDPVAGTFTASTATLATPRANYTATLLTSGPDTGKVLLAGGLTDKQGVAATAELYDPVAKTFTLLAAPMTGPRERHSATLLPGGEVLLAGGTPDGQSIYIRAEVYDAAPNAITPLTAKLTTARERHAATALPDGNVLLTGGTADGQATLGSAEVYDPTANTFTALASAMTVAREGHTATLLASGPNAGKVLLTGGTYTATAELYDPAAGTFTALVPTMTAARAYHTATLLTSGADAGKVLLAGGTADGVSILSSAEVYDPVANTFTALPAGMTSPRALHAATTLPNGQVLLTGGSDDGLESLNSAELYDPVAKSFTALVPGMTSGRYGHTATILPDGEVLIIGGDDGSGLALTGAELYDPVANRFKTALAVTLNTARQGHTATVLASGRILIAGGSPDSLNILNTAELYAGP